MAASEPTYRLLMRLDLHDLRAGGTPQFVHLARCYFGRLHQPGPPAWGVGAQERQPSSIAGCIAICICGSLCDHPSCIVLCKSQCLAGPLIVVALSRDADEHRERQQSLWKLVVCWLWCVLLGGAAGSRWSGPLLAPELQGVLARQ